MEHFQVWEPGDYLIRCLAWQPFEMDTDPRDLHVQFVIDENRWRDQTDVLHFEIWPETTIDPTLRPDVEQRSQRVADTRRDDGTVATRRTSDHVVEERPVSDDLHLA